MKKNIMDSYKILSTLKKRINIVILILSVGSLFFVLLQILDLGHPTIQPIILLSGIFVILFLPSYPLFFIIFKGKGFKTLEKLSLTIVTNSAFYIIIGYFGYFLGTPITNLFFFYSVIIFYFTIILYILYRDIRQNSYNFIKLINQDDGFSKPDNFSIIQYIKKHVPLNGLFLIIFIFLICILNAVKVTLFVGTDPWLHLLNGRIITDINYLPLNKYHGTMGISIFGAVINFFLGMTHIQIPKYFVFYTFPLSGLLFYNLCRRIFKSKNLAFLGVFILEFSSLGFSTMMLQYWPSGLATINCLAIFLILYIRIKKFIKVERPTKKQILSSISFTYPLIAIIFISATLTHVITTIFFLISFIWVFFMYFLKDYRRGFDLIFLCGLFGIFIFLNLFGIGSGHFWVIIPTNISWYYLLFIGLVGSVVGVILLWKILKSISFTRGKFKSVITEDNIYKRFEDKLIIPLIFIVLTLTLIISLILDLIWVDFGIFNIFYVSEIILLTSFAIWGLLLFQKKPKGKPLYFWGVGLFLLLAVGLIFNLLWGGYMIWQRILYLVPPVIVIGFVSYIYKIIKLRKIGTRRIKFVFLFIIIFSLFATYLYETTNYEVFTLKRRDVSLIQWYTNYSSEKNVIITEFGWSYAFIYYDYPFHDKLEAINYDDKDHFIFLRPETNLFTPSNHIENGTNLLQQIKNSTGTDVYLLFSGEFVVNKGFELFGQLSEAELEEYYTLGYLNKICSSRAATGNEIPLFWVI